MGEFVGDLGIVTVSEHVVLEDGAAEAGEADAAGLDGIAGGFDEGFRAGSDFLFGGFFSSVVEAGFVPMSVGAEHAGAFTRAVFGTIKAAGEEESRAGFEEDFFDGEVAAVDQAMNDGVQGSAIWLGKQADRDLQGLLDFWGTLRPLLFGLWRGEGEVAVEILECIQALIVWKFSLREGPGGC